jgi:hypothetical protein
MVLKIPAGAWLRGRPWVFEAAIAVLGLVVGVALMPLLIFYAGAAALGRYEGASVGALYSSLFAGLQQGSVASWLVLVGPYALYLLFRVLRVWWRAGATPLT